MSDLLAAESLMDEEESTSRCCEGRLTSDDTDPFASLLHLTDHCLYRIVRWARNRPDFANISVMLPPLLFFVIIVYVTCTVLATVFEVNLNWPVSVSGFCLYHFWWLFYSVIIALYWPLRGNAPWFSLLISALYKLFVCLLTFLTYFLPSFLILSSLLIYLLIYFLSYLSTFSRIGPSISFPGRRSQEATADQTWFYFGWLILCCGIFCCWCMFAFVVFGLVFQY